MLRLVLKYRLCRARRQYEQTRDELALETERLQELRPDDPDYLMQQQDVALLKVQARRLKERLERCQQRLFVSKTA